MDLLRFTTTGSVDDGKSTLIGRLLYDSKAIFQDQLEVTASQWTDPASCLQQYYDRQLWLAPPQVYELSKMLHMTSADDLEAGARLRQGHGLQTWLPVRAECEDGLVSLLPGDHMYPDNPDYTGDKEDRSVK